MQTCRSSAARIVPAGSGRSIFALPWLGHTLVGTTDNDYEGPLDHIEPSDADVHYLLDAVTSSSAGADAGRPDRRVRRRAAVDLDRRSKKSVDISRKASCTRRRRG